MQEVAVESGTQRGAKKVSRLAERRSADRGESRGKGEKRRRKEGKSMKSMKKT